MSRKVLLFASSVSARWERCLRAARAAKAKRALRKVNQLVSKWQQYPSLLHASL